MFKKCHNVSRERSGFTQKSRLNLWKNRVAEKVQSNKKGRAKNATKNHHHVEANRMVESFS